MTVCDRCVITKGYKHRYIISTTSFKKREIFTYNILYIVFSQVWKQSAKLSQYVTVYLNRKAKPKDNSLNFLI